MLKKMLKYTQKVLWFVTVFLIPSILVFLYLLLSFEAPKEVSTAFLYLVPIVIIVLFAWKTSRSLLALSLGFLITSATYPIEVWFIGGHYWRDLIGGFGGINFGIVVWSFLFSFPFTVLSFLPAIPSIIAWYRRKKR